MIYQISFQTLVSKVFVSQWNHLLYPNNKVGDFIPSYERGVEFAEFVKSSKDDTFIFILSERSGQCEEFNKLIEDFGLKDYVVVKSEGITNPVHWDIHYGIKLVILQSKEHFARIQGKEEVV